MFIDDELKPSFVSNHLENKSGNIVVHGNIKRVTRRRSCENFIDTASVEDTALKKAYEIIGKCEGFNFGDLSKCKLEDNKITCYLLNGEIIEIEHQEKSNLWEGVKNRPDWIEFRAPSVASKRAGLCDGIRKILAGIFHFFFSKSEKIVVGKEKAVVAEEDFNDFSKSALPKEVAITEQNTLRSVNWLAHTLSVWNNVRKEMGKGKVDITTHKKFASYKTNVLKAKTVKEVHDLTTDFYKNVAMSFFMNDLNKVEKQQFVRDVELEMGLSCPKKMTHEFTVGSGDNEVKVKETTENLSFKLSAQYLKEKGYNNSAEYIEKKVDKGGVRPSCARKGNLIQGMPVNLRRHTVQVGDKKVEMLRSGAFTIHDRKAVSDPTEQKHCVIAQALPKVIEGIKLIVGDKDRLNKAIDRKSFLYHEQSYLSGSNSGEAKMIQDVQLALREIGQDLTIRFSNNAQEGLIFEGEKMVYVLPTPQGKEAGDFSVTTVFTTHTVNQHQAFGSLVGGHKLQNRINQEGVERLMAYYGKEIEFLRDHYEKGVKAIDYKGMDLIQKAVEELGGISGYMCKSGKDRTPSGMNRRVVKKSGFKGDKDKKEELKRKLFTGLSYVITGQNTGKPPAYALISFQIGVGEHGYKQGKFFPPTRLCGWVRS